MNNVLYSTNEFHYLRSFAPDPPGQLNILGHDGHAFGMNGTQVGVLKQAHQVRLSCFLQGKYCTALEAQITLEVLCNFSHETLEWKSSDQQLCALLVAPYFSKCNCTRAVTVGLLHTTCSRSTLACSLGGQLFAWSFTSCAFASSLLCTGHRRNCILIRRDNNAHTRQYDPFHLTNYVDSTLSCV
jgi:hypothetical protein